VDIGRDLRGRVALVTGGGTGLGKAVATRLAAAGAQVAVNYAHSREEAEATAAELEAAGGRAIAVQGDVSDPEAVAAMTSEVERSLGPVDVLVASAGTTAYVPFGQLDELTVELWERVLRVNVIGAFLCAQAVAQGMRERGFGRIVAISSNSAVGGGASSIPYAVSKGALNTLVRCLAQALAPQVQVNAVAPGWMRTPWIEKHLPADVAVDVLANGQDAADVDEVARLVVEIAANGSITGQVVVVDRGETILRC
jgi:3-oxoacyl-[acyl-carrier protein] reductase